MEWADFINRIKNSDKFDADYVAKLEKDNWSIRTYNAFVFFLKLAGKVTFTLQVFRFFDYLEKLGIVILP